MSANGSPQLRGVIPSDFQDPDKIIRLHASDGQALVSVIKAGGYQSEVKIQTVLNGKPLGKVREDIVTVSNELLWVELRDS